MFVLSVCPERSDARRSGKTTKRSPRPRATSCWRPLGVFPRRCKFSHTCNSGRGMPVVPAHPYYHPYRHFDQKMYRAAAAAKVAQTTVLAQGQPAGAAPGQAQIAPAAKEGERTAATSVVLPYPEGEQGTAAAAAAAAVHDPNRQQQGGWMPHPDTQGLPNPFLEHGNLAAASAIPAAYGYAEWDGRHYPEYADAPPGQDPYAYARLGRRVPMMYPQLSREQLAALPVEQGGEWRPPAGQPGAPPAKWAQSQAAAQVQAAPAQPGQAPAPAAAQGQAPAPAAPPQQ
mmetsp:Transcript_53353/g.115835  ORF Transcript_53353/g.115835 Transcript_53353/m.115835 type:complete len:286 (+) Transcript_53353:343-1200(+)